ncbi:unnamed protein product [Hymenolepis diminuta]|uniref:Uncharacterized protein n=1 Tax=Hymenolepis diminuta TaxID=6216 RepID=A0A564YC45_HYMDI|nr:unnamed protein product [Hymenolepis diminuta]
MQRTQPIFLFRCYTLLDIVKALLYLIGHPNYEYEHDESAVPTKTARLLAGLTVDGQRYAPNESWCEWALANNCLPTEGEEDDNYCWTPPKTDVAEALSLESSSPNHNQEDPVQYISEVRSSISSETISSFAKIREALDEIADISRSMYERNIYETQRAFHRILLLQPTYGKEEMEHKTVYYYAEVLPFTDHFSEFGPSYFDLFRGTVCYDAQVDKESRQTCKNCDWYPFTTIRNISYNFEESILSQMNLGRFFMSPGPKAKEFLTDDFCLWAKLDHRGKNGILSGLFFLEKRPRNEDFTCFLDQDGSSSDGIGDLFNSNGNTSNDFSDTDTTNAPDFEFESDIEEGDDQLEIQASSSLVSDKIEHENQENDQDLDEKDISEVSTLITFESGEIENFIYPQIRRCKVCCMYEDVTQHVVNVRLYTVWSWSFRQTRWPFQFAPQQTVELTTEGVNVPPWRASAGQLLHDVCRVCSNCPEAKTIVLLDPLSLSPFSPILNLMQRSNKPKPYLTGILWMTPFQALSPLFRVPLPKNRSILDSSETYDPVEVEDPAKAINYPSTLFLRFLALDAYFTNLVSWLSRAEVYSSTGPSRISPLFTTDPMAARVLQIFSFGCGQAPLAGLWPLWISRHCMRFILRLPQMTDTLLHRMGLNKQDSDSLYFFPFSDLDEI